MTFTWRHERRVQCCAAESARLDLEDHGGARRPVLDSPPINQAHLARNPVLGCVFPALTV
jgi:hypothetical protein